MLGAWVSVAFNACLFYDTEVLTALNDRVYMGGDVLVREGDIKLPAAIPRDASSLQPLGPDVTCPLLGIGPFSDLGRRGGLQWLRLDVHHPNRDGERRR